jgi:hypothetical protein
VIARITRSGAFAHGHGRNERKKQENQDYFQLGTKRLFSQEDFERLIGFVSSRLTALDRPDVVGDKAQKGKISRD